MCYSCKYLIPVLIFSFFTQTAALAWGTMSIVSFLNEIDLRITILEYEKDDHTRKLKSVENNP